MPESREFWRGRRVLITGHTGFKGSWLWLWLRGMGAHLTGYALAPPSAPNLWEIAGAGGTSIIGDVRDADRVRDSVLRADPQVVFHLAAQALVRESYRDPLGTFGTNVLGTASLLQACRELRALECIVVVTSDKVYENDGAGRPFREARRMGSRRPPEAASPPNGHARAAPASRNRGNPCSLKCRQIRPSLRNFRSGRDSGPVPSSPDRSATSAAL